jgi:nucleotide-binding universal stress UspA family protein
MPDQEESSRILGSILKGGGSMISRILVATDGSDAAWKAVEYAVDLAKQTGARLRLLSVAEGNSFLSTSVPGVITPTHLRETMEDYLKQIAQAILGKAEGLCQKKEVPAQKAVRFGHPVEEILGEAEESKVDLIILGSHGKSSLRAALIGSVTFGVIHKGTRIPVLVVRG